MVDPPTFAAWSEGLWSDTYFLMSTETDGLCYGFFRAGIQEKNCHGYNLYVKPEHRRKGLASAVFSAGKDLLVRMGLESWSLNVQPENTAALSLYRSLEFETVGASCSIRVESRSELKGPDLGKFMIDTVPEAIKCDLLAGQPLYGLLDEEGQVLAAFQLRKYAYSDDYDLVRPLYLTGVGHLDKVMTVLPPSRGFIVLLHSRIVPFEGAKQRLISEYAGQCILETLAMKQFLIGV